MVTAGTGRSSREARGNLRCGRHPAASGRDTEDGASWVEPHGNENTAASHGCRSALEAPARPLDMETDPTPRRRTQTDPVLSLT